MPVLLNNTRSLNSLYKNLDNLFVGFTIQLSMSNKSIGDFLMDENILCTKTHEYVLEKDDIFEIGITDYAIEQLGDIVFIELPEIGSEFSKNEIFATIESVRAASEIYMPISGKVTEINEEIVNNPELLNDDNYPEKWLIKITSDANQLEFADLLDYSDYKEEIL